MKRVMFTGALLSIALAGASFASKASAAPASTTTTSFNTSLDPLVNPCNGLTVTFSGVLHNRISITAVGNGNTTIVTHLNSSNVKGTDYPFGNSYVGHDSSNDGVHVSVYGALVHRFHETHHMGRIHIFRRGF